MKKTEIDMMFDEDLALGCRCMSCYEIDRSRIILEKRDDTEFTEEEYSVIYNAVMKALESYSA
jgi:hypothetical protein